jgi:hypothetical protein
MFEAYALMRIGAAGEMPLWCSFTFWGPNHIELQICTSIDSSTNDGPSASDEIFRGLLSALKFRRQTVGYNDF